ncbi:hypothetical protein GCM10027589_54430 [Actinocorallia lasiicapitis]
MTAPNEKMLALSGTVLAWTILILSGLFQFFEGLHAVAKKQVFVVVNDDLFGLSLTGWGWIHMILGVALVVVGVYIMLDYDWARMVGVGLAMLSAVAQFLFIPHYPIWSIMVILLDVVVIWSLSHRPQI